MNQQHPHPTASEGGARPPIRILHGGRHLELVEAQGWEFVRRRTTTGVVGIIATTPARELLLVEQCRIPVGGPAIELPAGLVGDELGDEDLLAAANRELEEETGWRAASCRQLATGPSSAGLTSETISLVRAIDLRRVSGGGGVEGERITVHTIPVANVHGWLEQRAHSGLQIDHKIHAALWWLHREGLA